MTDAPVKNVWYVNFVSSHAFVTPLHRAVRNRARPAAVSVLVVAGADPWAVDQRQETVMEKLGYDDVLLDSRPSASFVGSSVK